MPIEEIRASGYNLDIANPHEEEAQRRDPEELLAPYRTLEGEIQETRDALKRELSEALG